MRAWHTAIAATPIEVFVFEPFGHGYRLAGRLDDLDVRAWVTDSCNSVRLYDDDWVHFALVHDTAWCSAERAIGLMLAALRDCGTQRPSDVARTAHRHLTIGLRRAG